MKIIDARWTPGYNQLRILCECGRQFWHRADRRKIKCKHCWRTEDCIELKRNYPIKEPKEPDW